MTFTQQWPSGHKGPVTTFMASCDGDCSGFMASDGKWFKIDQAGYTNGQWASEKLIAGRSDSSDTLGPIDSLVLRCRWQQMDFYHSSWAGFWAIRQSIPSYSSLNLTQLTFLPRRQLVRYEIVALHTVDQPQYYPGCVYVFRPHSARIPTT